MSRPRCFNSDVQRPFERIPMRNHVRLGGVEPANAGTCVNEKVPPLFAKFIVFRYAFRPHRGSPRMPRSCRIYALFMPRSNHPQRFQTRVTAQRHATMHNATRVPTCVHAPMETLDSRARQCTGTMSRRVDSGVENAKRIATPISYGAALRKSV